MDIYAWTPPDIVDFFGQNKKYRELSATWRQNKSGKV